MITKFKKQIEPFLAIIAYPFLSWNPHVLTVISVLFSLVFAILLATHNYTLAGLSWIGVIFDALDGYVARQKGKVTEFGAFLDSTMDRIADFLYIFAFGFAGLISWPLVSLVFLTSFLISYTKARGESILPREVKIKEGMMQRTERLLMLFIIFLLYMCNLSAIGEVVFFALLILNIVSIGQRMIKVKNLLS